MTVEGGKGPASCPPDAFFCEGFEGTLGSWFLKNEQGGATCAVSTTRAHGGSQALRAFAPFTGAPGSQNQCYLRRAFPNTTTGTLAVRAYVFIAGPKPSSGFTDLLGLQNTKAMGCQDGTVFVTTKDNVWNAEFYTRSTSSSVAAVDAIPLNRWFCSEWVFDVGTSGHVRAYVDDSLVLDRSATMADPGTFCGYTDFDVGLPGHSSSVDAEVFWDDIVVAPHRIGCN